MTVQMSIVTRNAALDAVEATIGPSPVMRVFGAAALPASCAAPSVGLLLSEAQLPPDWLTDANNGEKNRLGDWQDLAARASGTAQYWRIMQGGTCHMQGTITEAGGGGDMIINSTQFLLGQRFRVLTFLFGAGNA